ncbi:MAG TPA: hypothetical protein PLC88_01055 [Syntrophomonas sp.]|nr:hypothetical protein [Syntrophomonas sp.]HRW12103.1 hypothetical protein [Syntrophomonas sp.]
MKTQVAIIAVVVEETESAEKLNRILHQFGQYIIGRMGLPYQKKI